MKQLLSIFAIFSFSILYATGPSYIRSQFIPIAMNDRGEVLCKTRYEENGMGAHAAIRVSFGFCIITKDTLISYPGKVMDPDDYDYDDEKFFHDLDYWDKIYTSETSERRLKAIVSTVLKDKYHFEESNADQYMIDKFYSLKLFKEAFGIDLDQQVQHGLRNAAGKTYQQDKVKLQYHLGDIFIFDNYYTYEEEEGYGTYFNYPNSFYDYGEDQEYDVYYVNGYIVKE